MGPWSSERLTTSLRTSRGLPRLTDVERYADKAEYEKAVGDAKFEFEKLRYLSDGLKVVARRLQAEADRRP